MHRRRHCDSCASVLNMQGWGSDSRSALRVRPHPAGYWFDMPTWRSDASASHTPSRQSLLDEKSVSSRSGSFWLSSSAHLVVDSSGLLASPESTTFSGT